MSHAAAQNHASVTTSNFFAFEYPKQILGGSEDILDTIFEIFEKNYLQYIRGVHVG